MTLRKLHTWGNIIINVCSTFRNNLWNGLRVITCASFKSKVIKIAKIPNFWISTKRNLCRRINRWTYDLDLSPWTWKCIASRSLWLPKCVAIMRTIPPVLWVSRLHRTAEKRYVWVSGVWLYALRSPVLFALVSVPGYSTHNHCVYFTLTQRQSRHCSSTGEETLLNNKQIHIRVHTHTHELATVQWLLKNCMLKMFSWGNCMACHSFMILREKNKRVEHFGCCPLCITPPMIFHPQFFWCHSNLGLWISLSSGYILLFCPFAKPIYFHVVLAQMSSDTNYVYYCIAYTRWQCGNWYTAQTDTHFISYRGRPSNEEQMPPGTAG